MVVTNPGSTDANGNNPLKFSLPESGGKFSLDAGKNTATANLVLDMNEMSNDIQDAQKLTIGFQRPHTVTFSVPNGQGGTTTKVWHREKLVAAPTVTANNGYRFTGNWTDGTNTYTADQLKGSRNFRRCNLYSGSKNSSIPSPMTSTVAAEQTPRRPPRISRREGQTGLYRHRESEKRREYDLRWLE